MPRQKSAVPPVTRIRENQRRSRARRKELVEDLQNRLREYEEGELQATLAIQVAARHVAWENTQLRCLLENKGTSPKEIESFLRGRQTMAEHGTVKDGIQSRGSADRVHQCDASGQPYAVNPERTSVLPGGSDSSFVPALPADNSFIGDDDPILQMSCETAASIISSMRGHEDGEKIRWQLGCESHDPCRVKNVKVLQVMEME